MVPFRFPPQKLHFVYSPVIAALNGESNQRLQTARLHPAVSNSIHLTLPTARVNVTQLQLPKKYTASITGQFGVSIGSIEASVGFDHGEEFTVSASTTSASLSAGETVEVYWQKKFQKYTIQQEQIHWEVVNVGTDNQPILKLVEEVIATKNAYAYKPVAPKIRLEYYNTNARGQRVLTRVETINE